MANFTVMDLPAVLMLSKVLMFEIHFIGNKSMLLLQWCR